MLTITGSPELKLSETPTVLPTKQQPLKPLIKTNFCRQLCI
jgi:hypothetical protein